MRSGRRGFTSRAINASRPRASRSQRSASMKLARSTSTFWRWTARATTRHQVVHQHDHRQLLEHPVHTLALEHVHAHRLLEMAKIHLDPAAQDPRHRPPLPGLHAVSSLPRRDGLQAGNQTVAFRSCRQLSIATDCYRSLPIAAGSCRSAGSAFPADPFPGSRRRRRFWRSCSRTEPPDRVGEAGDAMSPTPDPCGVEVRVSHQIITGHFFMVVICRLSRQTVTRAAAMWQDPCPSSGVRSIPTISRFILR